MSGLSTGGLTSGGSDGLDSTTLLKLLADPIAVQESLKAFNAAKKEADDAIEKYGKIKDIEKTKAAIAADKEASGQALVVAQAQAAEIVGNATAEAAALVKAAKDKLAAASAKDDEATDALKSAKSTLANVQKDINVALAESQKKADEITDAAAKLTARAEAAMSAAKAAAEEAQGVRIKYEAKLKKLQAATSED